MVVDDHKVVRDAVVALLERAPDMSVCAETATTGEAEALALDLEPDVVVIDLHLGDTTCIQASRRIRERRPATQVVMLTAASDRDALLASILAGAAGYLPKQLRGTDLLGSVRAVAAGDRLLDSVEIKSVLDGLHPLNGTAALSGTIGQEELGVLRLLAQGMTDTEIGQELALASATVKLRVARLVSAVASDRPLSHASASSRESNGRSSA
jgi:DNA-binding NarL/FixJ family response regulator